MAEVGGPSKIRSVLMLYRDDLGVRFRVPLFRLQGSHEGRDLGAARKYNTQRHSEQEVQYCDVA